jgi:multicomponent Na+:H+ antiporter subunit C
MSLVTLGVASLLFAVGTYLILQRMLSRVIIGLGLISHGANLLIMLSGSGPATPPIVEGAAAGPISDPLPQALVLTAIVITFGVTAFLLALALRSYLLTGTDAVEDDIEDRRIARSRERAGVEDGETELVT